MCFHEEVKKGIVKDACEVKLSITYSQLFKMFEKLVQTEFSVDLKIADNFDWALKCNFYKVMLIISSERIIW